MKKIILIAIILMGNASVFARDTDSNLRYQYIHLLVKNHTFYPIVFTIVDINGAWKNPTPMNIPIQLNPNDQYENTLISEKKSDDIESFVSTAAAQIGNERNNYVIFAENGSSARESVSSDIFDGSGKIFTGSNTNYCNDTTPEGYADCELIVQESE